MMQTLMGSTGTTLIAVIIMCSTFGAINTNLLQSPRVTFAMGRDGAFFRIFGRVHAQFGTPAPAILLTALMAIALMTAAATAKTVVLKRDAAARAAGAQAQADATPAPSPSAPETLSGRVVDSLRDSSIFTLLTNFVIFSASVFYVLGVAAVIVLRQTRPDAERPYRTWGYPFVPLAFVGVYCWFLWRVYLDNPLEARTGLCFIALGVPVFLAFRWSARRAGGARKS